MNIFLVSTLIFLFGLVRVSFCMNGQVVHVNGKPSLGYLFAKDGIHHHLESCWRVGEPKEHNRRFEESFRSEERRFWFISGFDVYIVVSPSNIEFREEGTSA